MTSCERIEETRDYALGELSGEARERARVHTRECDECAAELRSLQMTTSALRALPDREIPRRIGFVSDKVFEPSPAARWFAGFWNSTARLGFASACLLAAAAVYYTANRPQAPVATVNLAAEIRKQVDSKVGEAVNQAVAQVRAEDARTTAEVLAAAETRHAKEHRDLLVAMDENLTLLQKRLSTYTMLAADMRIGDAR